MLPISIVILTKNEEQNIVRCLKALQGLANEVLVLDSGSNDKTVSLAQLHGAKIIEQDWHGYADTKNRANQLATNNWILSLDADEEINATVIKSIQQIFSQPVSIQNAFSVQRKMVYCGKVLNHGSVSNEFRLRLFNRQIGKWNANDVHEDVEFSENITVKKLNGFLWHHSYKSETEHRQRLEKYATLSAIQLFKSGKSVSVIKYWFSPTFGFIKNYLFKAGFLDGKLGYQFAKNEMWYVRRKYELLKSMV